MTDFLLDSHTVLWSLYEPTVLPSSLLTRLQKPDVNLFISEASIWELSGKAAKRRLPLAGNSVQQFMRDIEEFDATILSIQPADILASVVLPPHQGDPFDRLLIAQAQARNFVLVSRDADVAKYDIKVLWK